jgi:carbonic anhydrase/acetyltransferase-like protein (isoleucine patch superfamily)
MKYQLEDKAPDIAKDCFVAQSADLIGDVIMQEGSSVWFNCVVRADNATITIGKNSNVQDGSVLHVDPGFALNIGEGVTVGHKVMLHGCTIGDNSLIGINAVVLNGAQIGKNCIIGANALVTEGTIIADGQMALGSPAKVVKKVSEDTVKMLKAGAKHYVDNGKRYQRSMTVLD